MRFVRESAMYMIEVEHDEKMFEFRSVVQEAGFVPWTDIKTDERSYVEVVINEESRSQTVRIKETVDSTILLIKFAEEYIERMDAERRIALTLNEEV